MNSETRNCQNCKQDFTIEPDDFSFYEKIKVPPPTFCPECRFERRAAFRNENKLFLVKDAFTKKDIFSLYPPEANRKVVTQEEWHSDTWSAFDYGKDIDWSRPFMTQVLELEKEVPIYNLNVQRMFNSPYSGNATGLKNCYLLFGSNDSENCLYGNEVDASRDCVDNSHINKSERCYDCFWIQNCYQCYGSIMSVDCSNVWFSRDCLSCHDCIGCTNLRKSSYCIFNKQYTKEEYTKLISDMNLNSILDYKNMYEKSIKFWKTQINKYHQGLRNLDSTGSYVTDSKNVKYGYAIRGSENLKYCQLMLVPDNKDCYDCCIWGQHTELSYETSICGENSYNLKFCFNSWPSCRDSEYCMNNFSSGNCFGCVGLKSAQYCILNKQYSKEEYTSLVSKIKKHMDEVPYIDSQGLIYKYGEFFPIEFSPFGYNNSLAIQQFSMNKEEAIKHGYPWIEKEKNEYDISLKYSDLPQSISEVDNSILKEIIECEKCHKAYRIMPDELTFLKKENIPLPTKCVECRYQERIFHRLSFRLYNSSCMCNGVNDKTNQYSNTRMHTHGSNACQEIFMTGYNPKGDDIVYCEKCYQQEVV
ncbi:MAG: hypothetical protein KGI58_00600 [Patescibacteria group bacterium]|nr:hypothetical protein [Patescibacteria group bacterium]